MSLVDQHKAQLADPHPEGGIVLADVSGTASLVSGRRETGVDCHAEWLPNYLPSTRAYLLQEAPIAGRENIPSELYELSCGGSAQTGGQLRSISSTR